jgi:hypothetical protein
LPSWKSFWRTPSIRMRTVLLKDPWMLKKVKVPGVRR